MKRLSGWKKAFAVSGTAGMLAFGGIFGNVVTTAWAAPTAAKAVSDNIMVRDSAVSGAQVGSLVENQEVSIQGETTGSDGNTWYEIVFELNGQNITGWVRSDLLTAADTAAGSEGDNTQSGEEPQGDISSVHFELGDGYVDIEDVPEEQAALVSDRFVACQCTFEDSTVSAYQLASPDAMVADDADLTNIYYVYGVNDIGEEGWYTYDSSVGTLQKNIVNMTYSLSNVEEESAEDTTEYDDAMIRMIIGVLGLVCLLLLVLSIIFSLRYRRLRNILEDDMEEEETFDGRSKIEVPEGAVRKEKKAKAQKSAKTETKNKKDKGKEQENVLELHTPGGNIDLWDLDSLEDKKGNPLNDSEEKYDIPVADDAEYDIPEAEGEEYDVFDDDELDRILGIGDELSPEKEDTDQKHFSDDNFSKADEDELERILREERQLFADEMDFDSEDVFYKEDKTAKQKKEPDFNDEDENDDDLEFL